ncbi:MAG TPA: phenylalanine--tRNA ligase subunit alpha [Actinomycetota bacterium]|nr:phenylalanine--tRNA ligase subunit alpha [Actinomycetota bacterium]
MSSVVSELEAIRDEAAAAIGSAADPGALEEARVRYLGRKARLVQIGRTMKDLPIEEKRLVGPALTAIRAGLEDLVRARGVELEREAEAELLATDRVDLTLPGRRPRRGAPHPLVEVVRSLEDVFVGLGYEIAEGPEVETEWNNFEALNIPADHPTRTDMDSFYVVDPLAARSALLRTHTSPVQIRTMETRQPPIYVVAPGRAYRRDETDATHSPVFHQIEALAVDEGLSMADLTGTLDAFAQGAFGSGTRIRLVPTFFPFTEPSAQLEVSCHLCGGAGCSQCASGWLEIGGAGMVDPAVFEAVGIDPERYTGFAFGMGIERVAMIRYGITDIRLFLESPQQFLDQFRGLPLVR